MGTSGAYGGSGGWDGTREDTASWLSGLGGGGSSTPTAGDPELTTDDGLQDGDSEALDSTAVSGSQQLISRLLAGVTKNLASSLARGASGRVGGRTGGGTGKTGGGRRNAARSAGAAIAGVYGLRSGRGDILAEVGLNASDLQGLSPFEQAQRIVDVASASAVPIEDDELREVNAEFVWRSLEREEPASPNELVKDWVTEFVFRAWLTEAGNILRDGSRDGAETLRLEQEVRLTLEAAVARVVLPAQGLSATGFERAVTHLMNTLAIIFQKSGG